MFPSFIRNRFSIALIGILGLALLPAGDVSASAFTVTPVRVTFERPGSSTLLTLKNESAETLRFQISAFRWDQSPEGEMILEPTRDVLFFPALVSLDPGESRKVRLGLDTAVGSTEKTYRIFFEELPPLERPGEGGGGTRVRILTKMGIPIFVSPGKKSFEGEVADLSLNDGVLRFDVVNRGNVQFTAQSVRIQGLDDAGEPVFEKEQGGWYVLASGSRRYQQELSEEECAKVSSIVVSVQTDLPVRNHTPLLTGSIHTAEGCAR
jgi:fimbrial chaperone protein